jgi:hypothetical protein
MNITPEYLAALQSYGYTRTEAEFLYLVATHSGYFTQRQFLRFARVEQGGAVTRFTEKLLRFRHGRTTRYGYNTLIYNLYSRLIYGSINKDNLRNRRRLSNDLIRTRLLILDFVLGHLEHQYLETESDKVDYFHRTLCPIPTPNAILSTAFPYSFLVDPNPCFFRLRRLLCTATPRTLVYFATSAICGHTNTC